MSSGAPPRFHELLAVLLLRGHRAGFLRDGLREEHARRAREIGPRAAAAWYRRQVRAAIASWWRPENLHTRRRLLRAARAARFRLPRPAAAARPDPAVSLPRASPMDRLVQDLRFGVRTLRAQPTFAVMALLALALGTGGATAIFTVVDTVLLRPLPFPDPDRIMTIWETSGDWLHNSASPANFLDWRERSESFEAMAAHASTSYHLTGVDEPLRLSGARVTADFHRVLGVNPALGRPITPADDRREAAPVAVISQALFARVFGSDPDVVGSTIRIGGTPWTLIGVMPRGFAYPSADVEIWTPTSFSAEEEAVRGFRAYEVIGRLAPGVSVAAAHEEMIGIAAALREAYPNVNESVSANVIPLREEWLGRVQPTLVAMAAAVGGLLLVACANVANLLLARAVGRRGEIALRSALGAGPGRIVQQTLTESMLLGLVGAAAGMLLAVPGARFLRTLVPAHVPLAEQVGVDLRAVAFSVALALATAVLFGLVPAIRARRDDPAATLRGERTAVGAGGGRRALIVIQMGLAVVLLIAAGLLVRSFAAVVGQDLGFDPQRALTARVELPGDRYDDDSQRLAFYDELVQRARSLPGVEGAALITRVPLGMMGGALLYTPWGQETPARDATFRVVTPGYFATLDIGLRGRDFGADDGPDSEPAVIVSEALARMHWPGQEAIGQRLKMGSEGSSAPWMRVIGVAGDVRQWGLEVDARPAIYVPVAQTDGGFFAPHDLVVRAATAPALLAPAVRALIRELDPDLPVAGTVPLTELVARTTARRRFQMTLLGLFAGLAASIAVVGLYGIIAYTVQAQTHELGVRLALGAARRRIVVFVLGQGGALVALGIGAGVAAATLATELVRGMLFGVSPLDPLIFAAVPGGLAVVALLALLLPARRASRIDPTRALRDS